MKCVLAESLAARKWEHERASTEANSAEMVETAHGTAHANTPHLGHLFW